MVLENQPKLCNFEVAVQLEKYIIIVKEIVFFHIKIHKDDFWDTFIEGVIVIL